MKDYEEERKLRNGNGQIARIDAKGAFVEVIAPTTKFEQVTLNMVSLDTNFKQTGMISIYFDIPDFLAFCMRVRNREIHKAISADKQRCQSGTVLYNGENVDNGKIKYSGMKLSPQMSRDAKGTYSLGMLRGSEKDGNVISRQFWLCSSSLSDVVFTAAEGKGKKDAKGLIAPAGVPKTIRVPMSFNALEMMAEASIMRLYALETANAINGEYERVYHSNSKDTEAATSVQATTQPTTQEPILDDEMPDFGYGFGGFGVAEEPPKEKLDVHTVTGIFTSDFQSISATSSVVKMDIKGTPYTVYFKEAVPPALIKAQEMGAQVSINLYYKNGNFAFHSMI